MSVEAANLSGSKLLRGVEEAKIECARKLFDALSQTQEDAVKYDVVTDYGQLMQLVGASV